MLLSGEGFLRQKNQNTLYIFLFLKLKTTLKLPFGHCVVRGATELTQKKSVSV